MDTGELESFKKSQTFFISGIGQTKHVKAKSICGKRGVSAVETSMSFLDGFLGGLTFGLYTPRTLKVFCN